jgi:hypothetical protein
MEEAMDPAMQQLKLEEYRSWLESMRQNEEIGEKRLQFFVTLATAVLGGVMALAKAKGADFDIDMDLAAELARWALPALLIFGVLTFFRMLRRDSRTDLCKHRAREIERWFESAGGASGGPAPSESTVEPGGTPGAAAGESRARTHDRDARSLHHGGLTAIMLTMNAVLFGAWLGVLAAVPDYPINPGGLFLGIGTGWAAGWWCKRQSEQRKGLWANDDLRKSDEKSKQP